MIKDEEAVLKSLHTYFKANLNANITLLNTEKNDFTIDTITADDDHFVFGGELLEIPNRMFVNFAIADINIKTNHTDIIQEIGLMIEVAMDNPKKENAYFKSLRYMRSVYKTTLAYGASASEVDDLQITKALPMETTHLGRTLLVSGVELSLAIG